MLLILFISRLIYFVSAKSPLIDELMHLTIPEVFIIWDAHIRKAWGFKKGDAENYFNFLKKMQQEIKGIKKEKRETLAKCIDEYNYVKFTLPALEKQRKKRNNGGK